MQKKVEMRKQKNRNCNIKHFGIFNVNPYYVYLVFPVSIVFMELVFKAVTMNSFFDIGLFFMPLFSIMFGTVVSLICTSFSEKTNNILAKIFLILIWLIFAVQIVYHWCFDKYLILYSVGAGGADQVIEEGIIKTTLRTIKACALPIIISFIPVLLGIIFIGKRKLTFNKTAGLKRFFGFLGSLAYYGVVLLLVLLIPSSNEVYRQAFDPNLTAKTLGLINTELMDFRYNVLGMNSSSEIDNTKKVNASLNTKVYEPWKTDIDFSSLMENEKDEDLKKMHEYFAKRAPTFKNEYTGRFKGYNLIFVTAEGFSPYAIDKDLTPTLYKMYSKGFKFNNYYTPIWGVSTSDGEYVNCTGLIPKSGVWSFYRSGKQQNDMRFTLGRQFLKNGLEKVYAYHPHTYTYYHRDISHTNMGYDFKGYGNGLEGKITKSWPESDLETINATADEYISSNKQFHAYYMSVSGHLEYNFEGNAMAQKNKALVSGLNCSERVKAYKACNIELDRAMQALISKLEKAGVAEKTLIVIAPDHYPYGLEDKESDDKYHYFSEILGHNVETNFELYKSVLLMYSPSMSEPVSVEKYCSSLDILPTLSNLFDFEYDSRLLMGRDIFSTSPQLVVFSNRSFITEDGMYNSVTKQFTPFKGHESKITDDYIEKYKVEINNMYLASAGILDYDYYRIVYNNK